MPTPLDSDRLLKETFLARVEHYPVLGSTNDRAKQYAAGRPTPGKGAPGKGDRHLLPERPEGCFAQKVPVTFSRLLPLLVVADRQTAGRGRGSNRWWTGTGGLACSLLLDPRDFAIGQAAGPLVSLVAGLAVVRTAAPLLSHQPIGIHWPNDVFAAGQKLAGILVEVVPEGLYVIGIGLNTNNTIHEAPEDVRQRAVTLRDLSGSEHDHTEILLALLGHLETLLRQLGTAPEAIGAEADRLCLQRGQTLTLQRGRHTVSGLCLGVAPDGGLILDTPEGKRTFYSGVLV